VLTALGVVFLRGEDSTSTDALIVVLIISVQWVVVIILGVIGTTPGQRQPVGMAA
jgi:hypothetical protein